MTHDRQKNAKLRTRRANRRDAIRRKQSYLEA